MPCFRPIEVGIKRNTIYSDRSFNDPTVVPCGNCIGCRAEHSRQWAVRMMHESRMHESNLFITLTYEDARLPKNGSLFPEDLSRFIKRLRKTQERRISFFGCGEYGQINGRPHYHAVLFGIDFLDRCTLTDDTGRDYDWSRTMEDLWGRGITEIGSVTMASASYVSGYITKKKKRNDFEKCSPITGEILVQEFARMSLRPPIGQGWIKRWWEDVYPRDFVVMNGYEAKPPRYYDKWMDFSDEKGGTQQRRDMMEFVRQQRYDNAIELSEYQLVAGEKIATSRSNLFARRDAV